MIELHHLSERCGEDCNACEDAFRRHIKGRHPGIKSLAATFDYFSHVEWESLAVPVHSAVRACKHDALLIIERGGGKK